MHFQKLVHFLHRGARPVGNADLALGLQQLRLGAFLFRHRRNDGIHADKDAIIHARCRALQLLHARKHARQRAKPAHALHLLQLGAQIVHVELTLGHLRGERFGFVLLDGFGGTLNKADNVAHAEDASGNAAGVEDVQPIQLFAGADKLNRLARHSAHGERGAPACIAIHTGQYDARQRHLFREVLRNVDRVLPGQAVDDEQSFRRGRHIGDGLHFGHQLGVDMEPAGGIKDEDVEALKLCRLHGALGDIHRLLARHDGQGRNAGLFAQNGELFLRCRTVDVERRHHDLLAVPFRQPLGDLCGRRRFTGALQTHHHDDGRRRHGQFKITRFAAEHVHERIVDDFDDLLARRDRFQDRLADCLLRDLVDEGPDDRQRNVCLKQRNAHFAHRLTHIRFVERTTATQPVKDTAKPFAQTFEHAFAPSKCPNRIRRRTKTRRPAYALGRPISCFSDWKAGGPLTDSPAPVNATDRLAAREP